uniref:Uncharacterized protein n=1 Tax=Rhizophora mucronata TaxID=61149 RepID=A0A2P2IMB6_RHIMU
MWITLPITGSIEVKEIYPKLVYKFLRDR